MRVVLECLYAVLTFRLLISGTYCINDRFPSSIDYGMPVIYVQFKSNLTTRKRGFELMFTARGDPAVVLKTSDTRISSELCTSLPTRAVSLVLRVAILKYAIRRTG